MYNLILKNVEHLAFFNKKTAEENKWIPHTDDVEVIKNELL